MNRLPLAIATVSLSGTLPEKLRAAAAAGFDGVEIFENDLLYWNGTPRDLRNLAADLGLQMALFQPFRDFEAVPRERVLRQRDRALRKLDLMLELGTPQMLVCSNTAQDTIDDFDLMAQDLSWLADQAASRNLSITYEALAWGAKVSLWRQSWDVVRRADHPALAMNLDSFHVLSRGDTMDGFTPEMAAKTSFIQLDDAPKLAMDVIEWSRHFRVHPGQGELDVKGFLAPILKAGYQGPLSLEIFNDRFRSAPPLLIAEDGLRSLKFILDQCGGAAIPPPAQFSGWEFLEFATDDASAARLGSLLAALGFRNVGRHRRKQVELWRQGSINLVLNREPDSFAHSYFLLHGVSLCDTGYRVDHAQQAMQRAEAFGVHRFDKGIAADESVIPAVTAPDGSLIHFVDAAMPDVYATDFVLGHNATGPGPLQRIDHVSMAVPDGALGSWTLFCRAALGFDASTDQTITDPYGLVKSRVLHSADSSVRLAFNVSESSRTSAARSLARYGGAGVQHSAFACDDIFAAVAGAPLLPIPRNYYDDLEARYGLDEEFIDRLRSQGLLYDRDAQGGEYLHAYTEAFDGRFLFEIIERRNGYRGFGEANAGVRLAAQAQAQVSPYHFDPLEL